MDVGYLKEAIDSFAQRKRADIEDFESKLDDLLKKIVEELAEDEG